MCCSRTRSYATQIGISRSGNDRPVRLNPLRTTPASIPALDRASVNALDPPHPPPQLERPRPAPELSIVVPTFNERENVPRLVDTLRAALPDVAWELIIVDDNSPDGTSETAKRIAATDSRIRCVRRVGRRGLAGACLEGILSSQAQYVAVMDGDLQHDETLLLPMLALLRRDTANMVVATRYADGGSAAALSSQRARGSRLATRLAHHLLKLELSDPMSGFFMLSRELVEQIAPRLSTQGFKILLDIVVTAGDGLRIAELPFTFRRTALRRKQARCRRRARICRPAAGQSDRRPGLAAVYAVLPGRGDRHRGAFPHLDPGL